MAKSLWTNYHIRWKFITKLCGSTPSDPEIVKKWLEVRQPDVKPPSGKSIDEIQSEVLESLADEFVPPSQLVFQRNQGNLVLRAATIRAHMKDCARIISSLYVGKIKGERSFATKVVNGVYHDETQYWIPILNHDGLPYQQACGTYDKPVHARGPRGEPLNSIKQFEWVQPAMIEFRIKILGDCIRKPDLETLFTYGGTHGYGGERSDGEGRYTFEIMEEKEND